MDIIEVVIFFASLVIAAAIGASLLPGIIDDIKYNIYLTSTHSVALDVTGLMSLTAAATGDITIDYKVGENVPHAVAVENRLVNIIRVSDTKQNFKFSLPFSFTKSGEKLEQTGIAFLISRVNGVYRIVSSG